MPTPAHSSGAGSVTRPSARASSASARPASKPVTQMPSTPGIRIAPAFDCRSVPSITAAAPKPGPAPPQPYGLLITSGASLSVLYEPVSTAVEGKYLCTNPMHPTTYDPSVCLLASGPKAALGCPRAVWMTAPHDGPALPGVLPPLRGGGVGPPRCCGNGRNRVGLLHPACMRRVAEIETEIKSPPSSATP